MTDERVKVYRSSGTLHQGTILGAPVTSFEPTPRPSQSARSLAVVVAVAVTFISLAYFYQAGGWNQNSRYDLTRALVERGTVRIDDYHRNTGDKARVGDHFYTDKAPGQSLAAVPVLALARGLGVNSGSRRGAAVATYTMTVLTSALPAALMVIALVILSALFGCRPAAGLFAGVTLCLGTPMWAYASLFMGHALAASCLLMALVAAAMLRRTTRGRRGLFGLGLAVGGGAGWAVVTEYPAAIPAVAIAIYALYPRRAQWREELRAKLPAALGLALGAGACIVLLAIYHRVAFGSPWSTPLQHLHLFRHVREQPFTLPRPAALAAIFLGAKRGLLPLAPILLVSLYGFVVMLRDRSSRPLGVVVVLVIAYYALFNAAFATPMAGWSFGPRYMGAALPFWAIGLVFAWAAFTRPLWRRFLLVIAAIGVVIALVAVSTTAQPPEAFARPFGQLHWPAFADGDLSLNHQSFLEPGARWNELRSGRHEHDAFNLGELLGLHSHLSLVPLLLLWLGSGVVVVRDRSAR